jgi:hypothetical protein
MWKLDHTTKLTMATSTTPASQEVHFMGGGGGGRPPPGPHSPLASLGRALRARRMDLEAGPQYKVYGTINGARPSPSEPRRPGRSPGRSPRRSPR